MKIKFIIVLLSITFLVSACSEVETATDVPTLEPTATEEPVDSEEPEEQAEGDPKEQVMAPPSSEIEQAGEIEDAVDELETSTEELDEMFEVMLEDDELSSSEIDDLQEFIEESLLLMDYVVYLAETYTYYYAYLTPEEIEDVYQLIEDIKTIETYLNEVLVILEENEVYAEELLVEIETLMNNVFDLAEAASLNMDQWQADVESIVEERLANLEDLQATLQAGDRSEAIEMAHDYISGIRDALVDGSFSLDELAEIAQLGVNAATALHEQGGPVLKNLADNITSITEMAAVGKLGQLEGALDDLSGRIPAMP